MQESDPWRCVAGQEPSKLGDGEIKTDGLSEEAAARSHAPLRLAPGLPWGCMQAHTPAAGPDGRRVGHKRTRAPSAAHKSRRSGKQLRKLVLVSREEGLEALQGRAAQRGALLQRAQGRHRRLLIKVKPAHATGGGANRVLRTGCAAGPRQRQRSQTLQPAAGRQLFAHARCPPPATAPPAPHMLPRSLATSAGTPKPCTASIQASAGGMTAATCAHTEVRGSHGRLQAGAAARAAHGRCQGSKPLWSPHAQQQQQPKKLPQRRACLPNTRENVSATCARVACSEATPADLPPHSAGPPAISAAPTRPMSSVVHQDSCRGGGSGREQGRGRGWQAAQAAEHGQKRLASTHPGHHPWHHSTLAPAPAPWAQRARKSRQAVCWAPSCGARMMHGQLAVFLLDADFSCFLMGCSGQWRSTARAHPPPGTRFSRKMEVYSAVSLAPSCDGVHGVGVRAGVGAGVATRPGGQAAGCSVRAATQRCPR